MTTNMFEPIRTDGRAQWQVIYDEITERLNSHRLNVDDVITYDELQSWIGKGVEFRGPTLKAAEALRRDHQRSLQNVRGVGYKVIAGVEHVKQTKRQKRKASKALERSHRSMLMVDRRLLDMDQSAKLDLTLAATAALVGWAKETDSRVVQIEEDLDMVRNAQRVSTVTQRATEEEVAELKERLKALENQR